MILPTLGEKSSVNFGLSVTGDLVVKS